MAERNITIKPDGTIHTCDEKPLVLGDEVYRVEDDFRSYYGRVTNLGESSVQFAIPDLMSYGQRLDR